MAGVIRAHVSVSGVILIALMIGMVHFIAQVSGMIMVIDMLQVIAHVSGVVTCAAPHYGACFWHSDRYDPDLSHTFVA